MTERIVQPYRLALGDVSLLRSSPCGFLPQCFMPTEDYLSSWLKMSVQLPPAQSQVSLLVIIYPVRRSTGYFIPQLNGISSVPPSMRLRPRFSTSKQRKGRNFTLAPLTLDLKLCNKFIQLNSITLTQKIAKDRRTNGQLFTVTGILYPDRPTPSYKSQHLIYKTRIVNRLMCIRAYELHTRTISLGNRSRLSDFIFGEIIWLDDRTSGLYLRFFIQPQQKRTTND